MHAQSTRFRDGLNAVLADAKLKGYYVDRFLVSVFENGHSLHIGDTDSDEERVGRIPPSGTDGDDVVAVSPR